MRVGGTTAACPQPSTPPQKSLSGASNLRLIYRYTCPISISFPRGVPQTTAPDNNIYDLLIAGQGASGYAVTLYAARYQDQASDSGSVFGGETATGELIENYPGILEIDGFELMMKFREQAEKNGVPIVNKNVAATRNMGSYFEITTDEGATY